MIVGGGGIGCADAAIAEADAVHGVAAAADARLCAGTLEGDDGATAAAAAGRGRRMGGVDAAERAAG